jgi:hypothetical protein
LFHVPEANDFGTALAWGKLREYRFRTAGIKAPRLEREKCLELLINCRANKAEGL